MNSPSWNRPQFYSLTRIKDGKSKVLASKLACPPVNIGPRSTPNYADLAAAAVHKVGRRRVFAGQRADAFHVDLGSIFDLGALRPFENLHLIPSAAAVGVNSLQGFNVHSIALQVPIKEVSRSGKLPTNAAHVPARSSASGPRPSRRPRGSSTRRTRRLRRPRTVGAGLAARATRCSTRSSCRWPRRTRGTPHRPKGDSRYAKYVNHPELAKLLPVLYPGVFPHLARYHKARADLNAILLTGIPSGVVPGFQNSTGPVEADMLRLNLAIPPASSPNQPGPGRR